MPLKVRETHFPYQDSLIYSGQIEGIIGIKRCLFRGKVGDLPRLPASKRYNLRIRGRNTLGIRLEPLMCHARTDAAGDLFIHNRYAPKAEVPPESENLPVIPIMPRATILAMIINRIYRRGA